MLPASPPPDKLSPITRKSGTANVITLRRSPVKFHSPLFLRNLPRQLGQTQDPNANRFQARHVHHFVVVHVIDLAVRDEEKVRASNGTGGRHSKQVAAVF